MKIIKLNIKHLTLNLYIKNRVEYKRRKNIVKTLINLEKVTSIARKTNERGGSVLNVHD